MLRQKPTWYWLAPALVMVANGVRLCAYGEPASAHAVGSMAEFRAREAGTLPYYWATLALATLVLMIFGWKRDALVAWLVAVFLFVFGWWSIQPLFYA